MEISREREITQAAKILVERYPKTKHPWSKGEWSDIAPRSADREAPPAGAGGGTTPAPSAGQSDSLPREFTRPAPYADSDLAGLPVADAYTGTDGELELERARLRSIILDLRIFDDVKREAGPGAPLSLIADTNGKLLDGSAEWIMDTLIERIMFLSRVDPEALRKTPARDKVSAGATDPIRMFVKGEHHDLPKIRDGRFRLIASVSLIDQLVERFIGAVQNKTEVSMYTRLPSLIGLGLDEEHLTEIINDPTWFPNQPTVLASDVTGWDWSVQEIELSMEAWRRSTLMGAEGRMARLIVNRMACIIDKVILLSDGTVLIPGVGFQPSGSYFTGSGNGGMRSLIGIEVRIRYGKDWLYFIIKCVGDDSLESDDFDPDELMRAYAEIGHPCKNVDRQYRTDFEFCSTRVWVEDGYVHHYPLGLAKATSKYLQGKRSLQQTNQLREMSRNAPEKDMVWKICDRFGVPEITVDQNGPESQQNDNSKREKDSQSDARSGQASAGQKEASETRRD